MTPSRNLKFWVKIRSLQQRQSESLERQKWLIDGQVKQIADFKELI